MLNAIWLETFVTLCEVGHFTRAAATLNMTQPGVSQHVKKLEQQVGQALLSRDGKSFTPTPAGQAVLSIGHRRRAEEQQLRNTLLDDDPDTGQVVVACSGSLALLLYPLLLDMMAAAPALCIRLEAMPQTRIIEGVTSGSVDLGIADHMPAHARLQGDRIGYEDLCLILPMGVAHPDSLAELQALGFIAHPDGYAYADALLATNFPTEYSGADRLWQRSFVNQIGQIPEPVARGLGYTILPRSGVDAHPARDKLQVATLTNLVRHELWLIQRKARILPARARRVQAVITSALAAL
ncbi:DNA-binding transcriptional regulator, LysR family [Monaibacterium marinum]|uniref:DNA-binding transcriptional regulator, LysR family n=1 Tax=Pontivivens marinum TaxID=1690039 RepID=A0A2C9CUA2_9RHOB|nr:LysR family transcriptional regulator [Monaibacterium marinum]SOH93969.1 DNA-binding transcriptional regulator, LysR family [Monaibacterium marinum]